MSLQHQKIQQKQNNTIQTTQKLSGIICQLGHEDQCLTQVQLQECGCVIAT